MICALSVPCLLGFLCVALANFCNETFNEIDVPVIEQDMPIGPGTVNVVLKDTEIHKICNGTISCYLCPKTLEDALITGNASFTGNKLSCKLDNLKPDVSYRAKVVCDNNIAGEKSLDYVFKSSPVESVVIESIGSRSVNITMKAHCFAMTIIGYFVVRRNETSCVTFRPYSPSDAVCENPRPSCDNGTDINMEECDDHLSEYRNFTLTVDNLQPSTYYELGVMHWYCNSTEDNANNSFVQNVTTSAPEPLKVTEINVTSNAPRNITITWRLQSFAPATYTLYVRDAVTIWPNHQQAKESCDGVWQVNVTWNERNWTQGGENSTTQGPYEVAVPYAFWEYEVAVVMTTSYGSSEPHWVKVKTLADSPGAVSKVEVEKRNFDEAITQCGEATWESYNDVCVTWKEICPRQRATDIVSYSYSLSGNGENMVKKINKTHETNTFVWDDRKTNDYNKLIAVNTGVNYTLCVNANGLNETGPATCKSFVVPSLRPTIPQKEQFEDPGKQYLKTTSSIRVSVRSYCYMVKPTYGSVTSKGFVVLKGAEINVSNPSEIPAWQDRHKGYYQIRPHFLNDIQSCKQWKPFVIGNDTCDSVPTESYCNGPLDPGTSYSVAGFVCTKDGCDTVPIARNFRTAEEPGMSPYNIVAICLGLLCVPLLGFLVYLLFFRDRIRLFKKGPPQVQQVMRVVSRPMVLSKLEEEISRKERNDYLLLREEYEDIQHCSKRFSCTYSLLECNRGKNRFADISAYDHSRVLLSLEDDVEGSDYINANFIPGYNREDEFIATQGPLPTTKNDMWRMVWERQVPMIVMLTQIVERGRVMCDLYWSTTPGNVQQYGHVIVQTLSVSTTDDYVITTFSIKHDQVEDEEREVLHLHYLKWPDMTADVTLDSMIHFLSVVRHMLPGGATGPIVVHCSAGVGRTGTFICLDYIIQFIQEKTPADKLDILKFVLRMREKRCRMVQTDTQYIFIHHCARHLMANKRKRDQGGEVDSPVPVATFTSSASLAKINNDTSQKKPSDETGSVSEGADAVEADMNDEDVAEDDRLINTPSNEEKEAEDVPLASSSTEHLCSE